MSIQTVVVFPGRFQPFHKGHRHVYEMMKIYGDVRVAVSARADPFTFAEKKMIMTSAGLPPSSVVMTRSPYRPVEITEKYDQSSTIFIFAVSDKDHDRFRFPASGMSYKKNGEPAYFQKWRGHARARPGYGYIMKVRAHDFQVMGETMNSAFQLRLAFSRAHPDDHHRFITEACGSADSRLIRLFRNRLSV